MHVLACHLLTLLPRQTKAAIENMVKARRGAGKASGNSAAVLSCGDIESVASEWTYSLRFVKCAGELFCSE
ncbi:hypothetical protein ElyMa_004792700 [Elysia marginata]|uniref:Secreted protein n=1 Tax=Elysia marginata TaxID=1093978 RepID=A0AAV4ILQ2_9GAST|nr:hypothetical protein ElyMa_004792700 [Elysia marginata]